MGHIRPADGPTLAHGIDGREWASAVSTAGQLWSIGQCQHWGVSAALAEVGQQQSSTIVPVSHLALSEINCPSLG